MINFKRSGKFSELTTGNFDSFLSLEVLVFFAKVDVTGTVDNAVFWTKTSVLAVEYGMIPHIWCYVVALN